MSSPDNNRNRQHASQATNGTANQNGLARSGRSNGDHVNGSGFNAYGMPPAVGNNNNTSTTTATTPNTITPTTGADTAPPPRPNPYTPTARPASPDSGSNTTTFLSSDLTTRTPSGTITTQQRRILSRSPGGTTITEVTRTRFNEPEPENPDEFVLHSESGEMSFDRRDMIGDRLRTGELITGICRRCQCMILDYGVHQCPRDL